MLYVLTMMTGFVIGVMANAHLGRYDNLSKQQYALCVKAITAGNVPGIDKVDALHELHEYATDEQIDMQQLSIPVQELVKQVKAHS